jgi:hypothetical protein
VVARLTHPDQRGPALCRAALSFPRCRFRAVFSGGSDYRMLTARTRLDRWSEERPYCPATIVHALEVSNA